MSEIFNPNYNSLPKQVEINRRDIEELKSIVKQAYSTTFEYGESSGIVTIALTSTSIPQDTDIGAYDRYLITADGYLLETISISLDPETDIKMVNAQMVADIKGPAGERGLQGLPGEPGPAGPAGPAGTSFQITGYAETIAELPAVGQVGDAYAVGTSDPKDIYVWVTSPQSEWVNLGSMQGPKGDTGETGLTPNITANASVGSGTGTPSVTVTKSGTDENPVLTFAFNNLKGSDGSPGSPGTPGLPGADGVTPNITMNASVSNTSGIPNVTVSKTGTTAEPVFSLAFENLKGEKGDKGDPGSGGGGEVVLANHIATNMEIPANLIVKEKKVDLPNLPFQDYDILADIVNMENYTFYITASKTLITEDGVNWSYLPNILNRGDPNYYIGRNMIPCYGKDYAFIVDNGQLRVVYNDNGSWTFKNVTYIPDVGGDTLVDFDKTKFAYVYPDYLYMVSSGGNFYGTDLSYFDPTDTSPSMELTLCTSSVSNIDPSKMWTTYQNNEGCIFYNDGTTDYYCDLYSISDLTWNSFTWDNASISFNPQTEIKYCISGGLPITAVMLYGEYYVPYVDPANQTFSWSQYYADPVEGATIIGYQCFWTPQRIIWQNSSASPYTYYDIDIQNNKATLIEDFGRVPNIDGIWSDGFNYHYNYGTADSFILANGKWDIVNKPGLNISPSNLVRFYDILISFRPSGSSSDNLLYDFENNQFVNNKVVNNLTQSYASGFFELFGNYFYSFGSNIYSISINENSGIYTLNETDVSSLFSATGFKGEEVWKYNGRYFVNKNDGVYEITTDGTNYTLTNISNLILLNSKITFVKDNYPRFVSLNSNLITFYKFDGTNFIQEETTSINGEYLNTIININGSIFMNISSPRKTYQIYTQSDLKYTN